MVMKSAEDGRRYNFAHVLDGAMDRSVLVERSMSPQLSKHPSGIKWDGFSINFDMRTLIESKTWGSN
jgi:hypothetical protein